MEPQQGHETMDKEHMLHEGWSRERLWTRGDAAPRVDKGETMDKGRCCTSHGQGRENEFIKYSETPP